MPSGILDRFTTFGVGITGDHHYIHEGKGYVVCGKTGSIAAGASESISLKTPPRLSGKMVHFRPTTYSSTANALAIEIIQNAVTTGGTKVTPRNMNGNRKSQSLVEVFTGATVSVQGNEGTIFIDSVGSGGTSNRGGGSGGADEERVLKPDTTYQITFTNIGSTTATVGYYTIFWYEE